MTSCVDSCLTRANGLIIERRLLPCPKALYDRTAPSLRLYAHMSSLLRLSCWSNMVSDNPRTLGVADYLVVGSMLLCSISIGFYQAHRGKKRKQGTEGYLLGNRSMNFFPVAISVAVNFKSAVTIIGIPADVYQFGIVYAWCILSLVLITGPVVGLVILPVLYKLRISSAYEYLGRRYGKPMRMIATSGFMLQTLFYMGLNVYGPALALSRVTGFPQATAMLTTGFVCVTYTTLGGLRGVIWSDVFQAMIMTIAMVAFLIRGTIVAGGIDVVWDLMLEGGRSNLNTFDPDPRIRYTFWTSFFGWIIIWIGMFGTDQTNVQRYLSVKSIQKARWAMFIGTLGVATITSLAVGCGVVLYALFHTCDPIVSGCIKIRDELMPYAAMDIFRSFPGMRGLFLSGVFAASLSTVSSGLNAMVSVTIADYLKPCTNWSDIRYERLSRILTLAYGLVIIGTGFLSSVLGEMLTIAVGIVGSFFGAYLGIFLMGIWMPFANSWGAGTGFVTGVVASFIKFLGSKAYVKPLYLTRSLPVSTSSCPAECGYLDSMNATEMSSATPATVTTALYDALSPSTGEDHDMSFLQSYFSLSYFYTPTLGLLYTLFIGIVVSLLSGGWKNRHLADKSTMNPISIARVTNCFPAKLRQLCGVHDSEHDTHDDYKLQDVNDEEKKALSDANNI